MNRFDRNWQVGAAAARKAPVPPLREIPFGFATRVVALWRAQARTVSPDVIWERLSLRALVCASVLLLLSLAWSSSMSADGQLLKPALEHTVADLFWML
ncbi:MAG: hypothetical protein HY298_02345 [Verrucomicrobia bacterium]|nr:hypothetical protein [Verrucomicrobiota bacterium]